MDWVAFLDSSFLVAISVVRAIFDGLRVSSGCFGEGVCFLNCLGLSVSEGMGTVLRVYVGSIRGASPLGGKYY